MSRPHRNRVNPLHKWKSYWVLYFSQSINHSNYKMFNIFDLSDDDRNQIKKNVIENACLTLISTGNYNVR